MGDSMGTTARGRRVSVLTMSEWGPAFPRVAAGLALGYASSTWLPTSSSWTARRWRLTVRRAECASGCVGRGRRSAPAPLIAEAAPDVVLALPLHRHGRVVAGRTTGCPVVPWVITIPRLDSRDVPWRLRPLRYRAAVFRSCPRIRQFPRAYAARCCMTFRVTDARPHRRAPLPSTPTRSAGWPPPPHQRMVYASARWAAFATPRDSTSSLTRWHTPVCRTPGRR